MMLPSRALLLNDETVIIQTARADNITYLGYRYFDGGNGIFLLKEIELLEVPEGGFQ